MIWGGNEYKKGAKDRLYGACPDPKQREELKEHLYHDQSDSHWCTIGTLKVLIAMLYKHVCSVCEAEGLDVLTQVFILVLDCYAVHIGEEFLSWCKANYPTLFLLFIPANCTAWLQPLDISFNCLFKRILRQLAGEWLANYMRQQLLQVSDPTQVKLNITLSNLRPHFARWVALALKQINSHTGTIKRGWDESEMGEAIRLAVTHGKDCEEFRTAAIMDERGELFHKFTMKKSADLAEKMLSAQQAQFFKDGDLHSDATAAIIEHGPAGELAARVVDSDQYVWHEPEYTALVDTIRDHITQHQTINFVDESNQIQKKQRKK